MKKKSENGIVQEMGSPVFAYIYKSLGETGYLEKEKRPV